LGVFTNKRQRGLVNIRVTFKFVERIVKVIEIWIVFSELPVPHFTIERWVSANAIGRGENEVGALLDVDRAECLASILPHNAR
jgi:hypothetical protein